MPIIIDSLKELRIDYLDHGWVTAIYKTEFLEFCDLPPEYENAIEDLDLNSIFLDIIKSTDLWLSSQAIPIEEKSWASLSHLVPQKKVLAILAYFIDYGCKNVRTEEYRNNALFASRVYFKLLTVPGYKAYHIYHSQLFAKTLACLSFPLKLSDEASNFNSKELTKEVNRVLSELLQFVKDLTAVLQHLKLSPNDMNFEEILSNLIDVTGYATVGELNVDKLLLQSISNMIYDIIDTLVCEPPKMNEKKIPNEKAIMLLFKCILPKLITSCLDTRHTNKDSAQSSYVIYSFLMFAKFTEVTLPGYTILLQHLCYSPDGLERAEIREIRSKLVVGMMSCIPQTSYREFVKWVIDLSVATKLSHRQLALEILAKLLESGHQEADPPVPSTEATDNASPLAGSSREQEPQLSNEQTASQDPNVGVQPIILDEDRGSPLRKRNHSVMHVEILRAVYDRTNDESSTLRTRALTILTKCLTSKHLPLIKAMKHLNGEGEVSRLMAVAARSVNDERALVRKAAASLLLQLLARASAPLQAEPLAFLVSLSRDASLIVRTSAIAALGELLMVRPSEDVLNAFLDGPLHQVSDPETKVQEQVVALIEKILIDRLTTFTAPQSIDPMPWLFLSGIINRQKKNHLQKVCHKLAGKSINHRLVDILSTHLGALSDERDLQCLLLLTSVARHVDYSDVGFVFDYYYKLTDNYENRDTRLMKLTIELLGSWSRFMSGHERTQLREHLVQRLAAGRDHGCRIKLAQLASQLDPDNLTWATEMMQMSERRALAAGDVHEALRAADLSLVAPAPPEPALLRLFLAAIDAPPDLDESRCAMCVAGAARLCIRSRDTAAAAAPVFAELLARVTEPLAVRVNSLVGLSDICARYTCIVEPLLGTMCDCLSEDSPVMLRRMAVRELTRLLLGGFLRLRTPLYYRYCALLADEDLGVRGPAEYYVSCGLTVDTIYHHFVECVLHYNHDEKNNINFDHRQLIYDVMLQRMSLVQKLNIQCRLAREVLEHAADLTDEGDEELPPAMNAALLDTITLICGPRMKLPKKPQKSGDGNDIDDLQERVTTNIVSHKMKIQVAEVLVPAVLRLYTRLSPRGGQINAYLVQLANDLLKDYEQEIKELFEDNDDLMKSVRHFKETIGAPTTFGNVRNLVTSTAPPEPPTPRASRRPPRAPAERRRALRM